LPDPDISGWDLWILRYPRWLRGKEQSSTDLEIFRSRAVPLKWGNPTASAREANNSLFPLFQRCFFMENVTSPKAQ
jgi:hypothetical protein